LFSDAGNNWEISSVCTTLLVRTYRHSYVENNRIRQQKGKEITGKKDAKLHIQSFHIPLCVA